MRYTEEPHGLQLLNNVNMATVTQAVTQVCWLFGSFLFTIVDCFMLWFEKENAYALALALIGGWTIKTGAGVVDADNKRKASPEYAEIVKAKEEGRARGEVIADITAVRKNGLYSALTGEHIVPTKKAGKK